jgi:tetratricopeptide (TPR) repeat protein
MQREFQSSPLDELVIAPPEHEAYAQMHQGFIRMVSARFARLKGLWHFRRSEFMDALQLYMQGYAVDPTNLLLYQRLLEIRDLLLKETPASDDEQQISAALEAFAQMPAPLLAPLKGATPTLVGRLVATMAEEAAANQAWDFARNLVDDARLLAPDDPEVTVSRAMVLAVSGRLEEAEETIDPYLAKHPDDGRAHYIRARLCVRKRQWDEAFMHVEEALKSGAMTTDQLRADLALRTLQFYQRWFDLLEKYDEQ